MKPHVCLLTAAFLFSGCTIDPTGPTTDLVGLPAGLDVEFVLTPGAVSPQQAFTATLTVTNTTAEMIEVTTGSSCLVTPHVMRNGTRVPFVGSWYGCFAAITGHRFAPGTTLTITWDMTAELYSEHPGDVEGAPAPPSTYVVRAEFDTYPRPDGKPRIERTLVVR